MTITACEAKDLPHLIALYAALNPVDQACPADLAVTNLAQLQAIPGSAVLLGWAAGHVVSSCTLIVVPNLSRSGRPYALIENVVTAPAFRRQGHARRVLDAATTRAWGKGCYKVMLMTGSKDHGTLDFYEKAGFAQTKTGFQKRNI